MTVFLQYPSPTFPHDALQQLFRGQIRGIRLRSVFSIEECQAIIEAVDAAQILRSLAKNFSICGGMLMFATEQKEYHRQHTDLLRTMGAFALEERILRVFERFGHQTQAFVFPNHQVAAPFNIRELRTGGEITIHSEHTRWPAMKPLLHTLDLSTQLSFYVQLQASSAGGILELVGPTPNNPPWAEQKPQQIELNIGDMVIFDGGRINHRVTKIEGKESRWTLGGFASLTDDKIFLWG